MIFIAVCFLWFMIYLVVFCLELVNLLIFNSCFVNTDMSKLQGGSSGGDKYGYSSLSSSLFGFFLPLLDWNFGFFIGFAGAFVEVFVQLFLFRILLLDAQNAGFLFNYFLGFCSTLISLIGTIF